MLERVTELNLLLDFYNTLLTSKQRFALEMYYSEDLSLVEIAENLGISRQAVHDLLRRGEKLLDDYEEKLRLLQKHKQREKIIGEIRDIIESDTENKLSINNDTIIKLLNKLTGQEE